MDYFLNEGDLLDDEAGVGGFLYLLKSIRLVVMPKPEVFLTYVRLASIF